MERKVVYRCEDFGPIVTSGPDGLRYEFPVTSGIATYAFDFPITKADLDVLRQDKQRAALLYGALHHPFQLRHSYLAAEEVQYLIRLILHAPIGEVATVLNDRNRASNNAIYHLARMYADLDPEFR